MNSAVDVWNRVLKILSTDLTSTAISTWFSDCTAVDFASNRLYLHTPSEFRKSVIDERFTKTIKEALSELFSGNVDIVVLDDEGLEALKEASKEPDHLYTDDYTFEKFVVGNSNKFAHAAALAVSDGVVRKNYNPLFIYGESGLGKTHLLHAIRHSVSKKYPHYNIVFVKGEVFTNELIEAIQLGKNFEFREKYRGADIFLMDDIQFIAGRISTQEEFFNTFNTLYEIGKQIVFTSDRPPSDIYRLEDRLRGRLESSLIADIQTPDPELRIAIIRNKASQLGVILPDDVIDYIADTMTSNVRQLEGAVKMIIALRDIMDEDITVASVAARLKEIYKASEDLLPTVDTIIEETAKYYTQSPEELKSQRKTRDTAHARQVSMFLIRKLTNLSLKEIGALFGGRDHTTVLSSIRKIEANIEDSPDFSKIIRDITSNINSKN
ncbi:MAG: chromosomal replication initiator protein DnaA [Oscillospiraceae bacterium]|nr:chromosomal replication initiator protein DnaA [Oscillospiraceae bacterium]